MSEQEKQQRNEDYKWEIHPGMVLRIMFWADAAKGGDPKKFKVLFVWTLP